MYILESICNDGFIFDYENEAYIKAYQTLRDKLDGKNRTLLLQLEDEKDSLVENAAREGYLRGFCMGLAFADLCFHRRGLS